MSAMLPKAEVTSEHSETYRPRFGWRLCGFGLSSAGSRQWLCWVLLGRTAPQTIILADRPATMPTDQAVQFDDKAPWATTKKVAHEPYQFQAPISTAHATSSSNSAARASLLGRAPSTAKRPMRCFPEVADSRTPRANSTVGQKLPFHPEGRLRALANAAAANRYGSSAIPSLACLKWIGVTRPRSIGVCRQLPLRGTTNSGLSSLVSLQHQSQHAGADEGAARRGVSCRGAGIARRSARRQDHPDALHAGM